MLSWPYVLRNVKGWGVISFFKNFCYFRPKYSPAFVHIHCQHNVQRLLTETAVSILVQHKSIFTIAFEHPVMQLVTQLFAGTAMSTAPCKQKHNHVSNPWYVKELSLKVYWCSTGQEIPNFTEHVHPLLCSQKRTIKLYLSQLNSSHRSMHHFIINPGKAKLGR